MVLDVTNPDNADAKKEFGIDEILTKLTDGLFGILFVTNKHTEHNLYAHFLEIFIDHMQDLAFPLSFVLSPWISSISWFQTVLNWFSPERLIGKNQIIFFILLSVIGATLVNALFVGYSFSQNNFRFIWTLKILRITLGLFATVLFIPILAFFAENVASCTDSSGKYVTCFNGDNVFRSVVTLVFTAFFIGLALAVKATFFDSDPHKNDVTGRPHSRLDILYTGFRGVLTILSIALPAWVESLHSSATLHRRSSDTNMPTPPGMVTNTPTVADIAVDTSAQNWIMTGACVLLSGILAFGYIWFIPFYNFRYSILRAGMMVNFFWASLCLFYTNLFPRSDIGIIYLIGCPFTFILGYYLVHFRKTIIQRMAVNTITDPFTLELKIRFRLMDAGIFYKEITKNNAAATQFGRSPGDLASPTTGVSVNDCERKAEEAARAAERALLDEINEMYLHAAKLMPKSCMLHLFMAAFHLNFMANRAQCLSLTAKAATMNPQLDEAFMVFKRQRLLNDRFGGGDVIDFIAYEQNLKLAKQNERRATIAGVQFWSELMKRNPSFHKLQSHGAAISTAVSLAQTHFTTLLKLSPDSPAVYRMYGRFLINALNDKKNGQDLLDHADEIEEEAERDNDEDYDDDDDGQCSSLGGGSGMSLDDEPPPPKRLQMNMNLFSEDNCVFTISGERHNVGQILTMNAKAHKVFGWKKGEAIGKNITIIVPSPFSEPHDAYLHKYLDTGFAKVIDRSRQVLGLHKDGYLIPLILCVKHVVDGNGKQSFIGVIKPTKESTTSGFIIFNGDDLRIKNCTKNIQDTFDVQPSKDANKVYVGDLFPGLNAETAEKLSSGGYQTELKITDDTTINIKVTGEKIQVSGASVYIARVIFKTVEKRATLALPRSYGSELQQRPSQGAGSGNQSLESMNADIMPMVFSAHNSKDDLKSSIAEPSEISHSEYSISKSRGSVANGTQRLAMKKLAKLNDVDKKSDQRSESGFSKASSTRNIKRLISDRNNSSNQHLTFIQFAYILCILILSGDAIYEDMLFVSVYEVIRNKIDNLNARLQSALYIAQISDSVRSLDLHRIQFIENNNLTMAQSLQDSQSQILNNTLYIASMLDQFIDVPGTATLLNRDNGVNTTVLNFEAINMFLSSAQYVAQNDMTDSNLPNNIQFMLDNGPGVIMSIMNQSAVMQRDDYQDYTRVQPRTFLTSTILAPVICIIIIMFVIFPVYYHIEKYRNRFLKMFCDIPKDVVKGIHDAHLKRLIDAQEEEDESDDKEFHGHRLAIDNLMIGSEYANESDGIPLNATDAGTLGYGASLSENPSSKFTVYKAFVQFFNSNHRIGPYSMVLFIITCIYFATMGVLSYEYVVSMQSAATSSFWAIQRLIYSTLTVFGIREQFLGSLFTVGWHNGTLNGALHTIYSDKQSESGGLLLDNYADSMEWMGYGRLYGNPQMNTVPLALLDDSTPYVNIELDDGCPVTTTDPTDCPSFLNNVLHNGIHSGMEWLEDCIFYINMIQNGQIGYDISSGVYSADSVLTNLRKLNTNYLTPNINTASQFYWQSWRSNASQFSIFQITFTCCYIFALLLLYIFVIRLMLKNMSQEMRRTSALVHMLPPEIISTVPSFKAWAAEMGLKKTKEKQNQPVAQLGTVNQLGSVNENPSVDSFNGTKKEIQFKEHTIHIEKAET
ncbi:hypothetical protein BCR33DRAFT_846941 [Rhizoclosmatium globosum]|uniref:PAS domain-containing protein n=1 Tax=Rhizoclosmatium globosum TaxID=329046 RepID=A0A1Y2CTU6_9FUNG|nr:hypothetical protein BCR33DRAFT_846941 [Rhizoclosmatium globosum]|eukprot:ORY50478.1 hypothetical protein BCR33DRAFT_846941 [Rhizoclosmatium globosum]